MLREALAAVVLSIVIAGCGGDGHDAPDPIPPVITTGSSLPSGVVGVPYSVTFAASGGVPPLTWSLSPGSSFPPGVTTLDPLQGTFSGTPATAGTFTFSVSASGIDGGVDSDSFSLVVLEPPTITTTSPLPAGFTGISYSATLVAVGGTQPYAWTVVGGAVPAGLTLGATSGTLSGTPTAPGTATFDARVTGNDGAGSTKSFSITITQLAPGLLYVKTNGGPVLEATNLTTWRFSGASTIDGVVSPTATIDGSNTGQIHGTTGLQIALDATNNRMWFTRGQKTTPPTASAGGLSFSSASTANGNIPTGLGIAGGLTGIVDPTGIAIDAGRDILYMTDGANRLLAFRSASTNSGDRVPDAQITGATSTLTSPLGLFIDTANDRLYIGGGDITIDVKVYDNASQLASGDVAPTRRIVGAATMFNQPRSVFVDVNRNLLYVGDSGSDAICIFENASTVTGNTAPSRRLVGANTTLGGFFDMTVHPQRNEIYVANPSPPSILVFTSASTTTGNMAPARTVTHPDLETADRPPNCIAIDPTR